MVRAILLVYGLHLRGRIRWRSGVGAAVTPIGVDTYIMVWTAMLTGAGLGTGLVALLRATPRMAFSFMLMFWALALFTRPFIDAMVLP